MFRKNGHEKSQGKLIVNMYADRQPLKRYEGLMKMVLTYIYTDSPGWPERKVGDESALLLTKEDLEGLEVAEAEASRFGLDRLASMCRERRFITTVPYFLPFLLPG